MYICRSYLLIDHYIIKDYANHIDSRNRDACISYQKAGSLADAAKQRGIHVFHLNIGQPDLPTPQAAIDAIRNIDRKVLEYSPSAGYRSYREKLVGYYEKFNINLTADDIIITTGGSEAVLFSFMSCLNPEMKS